MLDLYFPSFLSNNIQTPCNLLILAMQMLTSFPTHRLALNRTTSTSAALAPALLAQIAGTLATSVIFVASTLLQTCRLLSDYILKPTLQSLLRASKCTWKSTEKFRDACFYHFLVWILNPYALALFIFWPGWIVVGAIWLLVVGW